MGKYIFVDFFFHKCPVKVGPGPVRSFCARKKSIFAPKSHFWPYLDFVDRLVIDLFNNFYTGCSKNVVAITADQAIIIGQPVQQGCPKIILSLKKLSML